MKQNIDRQSIKQENRSVSDIASAGLTFIMKSKKRMCG